MKEINVTTNTTSDIPALEAIQAIIRKYDFERSRGHGAIKVKFSSSTPHKLKFTIPPELYSKERDIRADLNNRGWR